MGHRCICSNYRAILSTSAKAIFGKQKQMSQIREYDAQGYRVPSTGGFVAPASALEPEVQAAEN